MLNTLIAIQTIIINLPQPIISSNTITTALPLLQPNNTRGLLYLYIVVLEEYLVDAFTNSYIFIHDNALIYTTLKVRK